MPRNCAIKNQKGFTMIELLFAMSFVSVLLILILTATIQIARIYNKGITLKQVNQSGLLVGSDLRATIKGANAPLVIKAANGRLCLGTYSYVWNIGDTLNNTYAGDAGTRIGLVKVTDPAREMCDGSNQPVPKGKAREMLTTGASGGSANVALRLRSFTVTPVAQSGLDYAYALSYTLSTDDNALITDDSTACRGGKDDEFCALNRFDFITYARQGGSGTQ